MNGKEKQKTCQERVASELQDRIEDLKKLWDAYCEGKEEVEDLGNIFEYGLGFDYVSRETFDDQDEPYFRYQLSWGGPSDEFRFFTGPDFEINHIEYWFLDWFDGANIILSGGDEALLEEIWQWFKDGGSVQVEFDKGSD